MTSFDRKNSQSFNFKGASGFKIGSISQASGTAEIAEERIEKGKGEELPTTVLFLAANPAGTNPLRLDLEARAIDEALRAVPEGGRFKLEQVWAVSYFDVQEALLRVRPDIVHFSGHGNGAGELLLEPGAERRLSISLAASTSLSRPSSLEAVSRLFSLAGGKTRCVVLNACSSEAQARAIAEHTGCVIGVENPIRDASAIRFARSFYQALASGLSLKTAFDLGCTQIDLGDSRERATPRLFSNKLDPKEVLFV